MVKAKIIPIYLVLLGSFLGQVFQMVESLKESMLNTIGYAIGRVGLYLIVLGIVHSLIIKHFRLRRSLVTIFVITAFFLIQAFRMVGSFGLNGFGELVYSYGYLFSAIYIPMFFSTSKEQKNLFVLTTAFCLAPIVFFPIIGQLKGWVMQSQDVFYQSSRYFPSSISLGLVFGLAAVATARQLKLLEIKAISFFGLIIAAVFIVLWDAHRSVWLVSMVILIAFVFLGVVKLKRTSTILFVFLSVLVVFFMVSQFGGNISSLVTDRLIAFSDPASDKTASWRILMWLSYYQRFLATPILGEGLGGMWSTYIVGFGEVIAAPHNLYLQIAVKTGIIGLSLYFFLVFDLCRKLIKKIKFNTKNVYALVGLSILIAVQFYHVVYSLETFSWVFLGIGLIATTDDQY